MRGSASLWPRLSPRDRRTLAVGGSVVLALLVVFRGAPAWRAWVQERRAAAAELTARVAVARTAIRQQQAAGRTTDSLTIVRRALQPALLDGDTPAQGGAALASYLADEADAAAVQLGTMQLAIDSAAANPLYRVRVRADLTGDVEGILGLLHALETGAAPLVAVRTLGITPAEPAAPATRAEVLRASIEIEGLVQRSPSPLRSDDAAR